MIALRGSASLAARLVVLFVAGSALIMSAAGYELYHALRMQHEAGEAAEIVRRTQAAEALLRGLDAPAAVEANLSRIRDLSLGYPQLEIGVVAGGHWLLPLGDSALAEASLRPEAAGASPFVRVESGGRTWLVHRVRHEGPGGPVDVILALDTSQTRELLRSHAIAAALVALVGTAAAALLAIFVVRSALAPLGALAARAGEVTAARLGARLDVEHAPREVHGLADSINRMLGRLEESFRALEQFSADIAHELRTPINNLLLQTQVTLSRPRPAEEYREALHSNLEELERLQRMVSEMLFLARADRGMIELSVEDIDLAAEAASVADYFEAAAAEKSQAIEVTGAARLRGDRSLARRAITNLVSNAVRYSPPSTRIRVVVSSGPGGASLAVSNPAAAIPDPELKRLFSRFARRDESRSRAIEGAGLGLAIVDSIMKLQGGSVDATSATDGVTFVLRFPRAATPA